ncbi:YueI family protein [Virgibacillus sp. MSJ-26]|uniref:YueI family protein n=1 Tax=Virgibacillus sp. MSJ-26 TaxID=2841522 RepID=UPI001C0FEFFC|nr:YueI family protein [Virgibacillus sp. MSJ-26]MBU5466793.1 YueI family protein [Virgibacillus sp. MSJ-26]
MTNKNIDDYLTEGMHGTRLPKQAERDYFLGTLRERVILALKIGEVMQDRGLKELDQFMREYPEAKLIFNGHVAHRFQVEEKKLAAKHKIDYTVITNEENQTDIGAVLAFDTAVDREKIYLADFQTQEDQLPDKKEESSQTSSKFFSRIKDWLS